MAPADTAVAPSESERRQEVFLVTICHQDEDADLHWIGDCHLIERDEAGKITGTKSMEIDGVGTENFRTRNLMPSRRPTPAQVAEANELLRRIAESGSVSATAHRRTH